MKINPSGSFVNVKVSADEVRGFNRSWPCSPIPAIVITFEFDRRNGDLVGIESRIDSAEFDGDALLALSQDAEIAAIHADLLPNFKGLVPATFTTAAPCWMRAGAGERA